MTKLRNLRLETLLNATTLPALVPGKDGALPRPGSAALAPQKSLGGRGFSVHQRSESRRPQTFVNRRRGK